MLLLYWVFLCFHIKFLSEKGGKIAVTCIHIILKMY